MSFDFDKACDMVHHNSLLDKLVKDELAKQTRRWVVPSDQKDRGSDMKSNWLLLSNGVSQVSMMVPPLFTDLVSELHDGK